MQEQHGKEASISGRSVESSIRLRRDDCAPASMSHCDASCFARSRHALDTQAGGFKGDGESVIAGYLGSLLRVAFRAVQRRKCDSARPSQTRSRSAALWLPVSIHACSESREVGR